MKRLLTTTLWLQRWFLVWPARRMPRFPGLITAAVPKAPILPLWADLNIQHQQITKTSEGVWAANSGSISADEAALTSTKPAFAGYPSLMPHQG